PHDVVPRVDDVVAVKVAIEQAVADDKVVEPGRSRRGRRLLTGTRDKGGDVGIGEFRQTEFLVDKANRSEQRLVEVDTILLVFHVEDHVEVVPLERTNNVTGWRDEAIFGFLKKDFACGRVDPQRPKEGERIDPVVSFDPQEGTE